MVGLDPQSESVATAPSSTDINALPKELLDIVFQHLRSAHRPSLLACSLVCHSWSIASRRKLFEVIVIQCPTTLPSPALKGGRFFSLKKNVGKLLQPMKSSKTSSVQHNPNEKLYHILQAYPHTAIYPSSFHLPLLCYDRGTKGDDYHNWVYQILPLLGNLSSLTIYRLGPPSSAVAWDLIHPYLSGAVQSLLKSSKLKSLSISSVSRFPLSLLSTSGSRRLKTLTLQWADFEDLADSGSLDDSLGAVEQPRMQQIDSLTVLLHYSSLAILAEWLSSSTSGISLYTLTSIDITTNSLRGQSSIWKILQLCASSVEVVKIRFPPDRTDPHNSYPFSFRELQKLQRVDISFSKLDCLKWRTNNLLLHLDGPLPKVLPIFCSLLEAGHINKILINFRRFIGDYLREQLTLYEELDVILAQHELKDLREVIVVVATPELVAEVRPRFKRLQERNSGILTLQIESI
ncbi:hypothetical protein BDQ12DRAFT_712387 [Crucibulum laeve]|uniref:F-box domain-containing protein n=1 Tax=Crucibulum laeve TaxID=68775 RepID=A0A5C3M395_9AGAR|nr:hypothetical protein BDQ12DRAFT_712387 [Crucibulum laeve]